MSKRIEDLPRYHPTIDWLGRAMMHRYTPGDWINLKDLPQPRDTRKDPPPNGFYFGQWSGIEKGDIKVSIAWTVYGEWYTINEEGTSIRVDAPDFWCEVLCWGHMGRSAEK